MSVGTETRDGVLHHTVVGMLDEETASELKRVAPTHLFLSRSNEFLGGDMALLNGIPSVKTLSIQVNNVENIQALALPNLEELTYWTFTKQGPTLTNYPRLRSYVGDWREGLGEGGPLPLVDHLYLDKYRPVDLAPLSAFEGLEKLTIVARRLEALSGLQSSAISSLKIAYAKKLTDVSELNNAPNLRALSCEKTTLPGDLEWVRGLKALEWLSFHDCVDVASLAPLFDLPRLKAFTFIGKCVVRDGDIQSMVEHPSLATFQVTPKRTYNAAPSDIVAALATRNH